MGETMLNHNSDNTVKIKLKNDDHTTERLVRDGVPGFFINLMWDTALEVVDGESFTVSVPYKGRATFWCIAPECVTVVDE